MKTTFYSIALFAAAVMVFQSAMAQQEFMASVPVHMSMPEGVDESSLSFLTFDQMHNDAEQAHIGAAMVSRRMRRAKKDPYADAEDDWYLPTPVSTIINEDTMRKAILSMLKLYQKKETLVSLLSGSASPRLQAVLDVIERVINTTCTWMRSSEVSGIGSEFNCSDAKELNILQVKIETYLALREINTDERPLQMLNHFSNPNVHSQDRHDYWSSHVLHNCSNIEVLGDGVAAAHALFSRHMRKGGRHTCCIHSLFDPHPKC